MIARIQNHIIARHWPAVALAASLAMLAGAHGFERIGKMMPCLLCLTQREAYWAAAAVGLIGLLAAKYRPDPLGARAFNFLLFCAFGAGATVAAFHVGVEYKWWPGPAACSGAGALNVSEDILGSLSKSMEVHSCDKVAWSMFGISMAGWNFLISLGLAFASALLTLFPARDVKLVASKDVIHV